MITTHPELVRADVIEKMEVVIHNYDCKIDVLINYFILDTMTFE